MYVMLSRNPNASIEYYMNDNRRTEEGTRGPSKQCMYEAYACIMYMI